MRVLYSNICNKLWRIFVSCFAASLLFSVQFFSTFSSQANAADIYLYENEYLKCSFKISGPIVKGDTEKLKKLVKSIYSKPKYYSLIFPNSYDFGKRAESKFVSEKYSERKHRICLDSTGGNFVEALKLSDFFMPGLGTAVERNANCLSACAIMFMAGAYQSETGAGVLRDRYLHAGGMLGFHSPSLRVEDGVFDSDTVERAYDIAIQTIAGIQSRLLNLKIGRGLLQAMLSTPAKDMFLIKTTGQAAQWDIPIVGTVHPKSVNLFHAEQACDNFMRYFGQFFIPINEGRLESIETTNDEISPLETVTFQNNSDSKFELNELGYKAKLAGYGQEGGGFCNFEYRQNSGSSELEGYFGEGSVSRDLKYFVHGQLELLPFHLFVPGTQIKSIVRQNDDIMERISFPSTNILSRDSDRRPCIVISQNKLLDAETCDYSSITRVLSKGIYKDISKYKWPSGAITVVETINGSNKSSKINGREAVALKSIAFPKGLEPIWKSRDCLLNQKSGNVFCSKYVSR